MIGRVLAVLAAVALAGALVFAYVDDATHRPVAPQGDMLGTESGESFSSYVQRAGASLAEADETAYALVTFAGPLDPAEAAAVLEPVDRVNAMIVALAAPFPLPEPVAGETRRDVFERELGRIADSLAGVPSPERIDAVVVRDGGDVLRAVASQPQVAAVEVLPPDAAWGRFGVRPVETPAG